MRRGDRVIVIDEGSDWYGHDGQISGMTVTGLLVVSFRGGVDVFDAHQLELAQLVAELPMRRGVA